MRDHRQPCTRVQTLHSQHELMVSQPELEAENEKNLIRDVIASIGCSLRKLSYLIPTAHQHLADILDRCDLL
jgi:hypothetical protein